MNKYAEVVHKFAQSKVLVVGDAMQDVYHFGRVDRLSPEAPVPVFIEERQKGRPGGAANVAANLQALGCQVKTVMPRGPEITMKHRYMVGHHQLFRVDHDVVREPTPADISNAEALCDWADVVVLSDYAKGWLTREMCQSVIQRRCAVVDPKGRSWSKYERCEVICPNTKEMIDHAWDGALIEKRGSLGLRLYPIGQFGPSEDFPARARHVYDVTGAGDTVVAVVAACLSVGADLQSACVLANAAASVVVGKVGTSECSAEELICALDSPTDASTNCIPDTVSSSEKPASTATGLFVRSIPTSLSEF